MVVKWQSSQPCALAALLKSQLSFFHLFVDRLTPERHLLIVLRVWLLAGSIAFAFPPETSKLKCGCKYDFILSGGGVQTKFDLHYNQEFITVRKILSVLDVSEE